MSSSKKKRNLVPCTICDCITLYRDSERHKAVCSNDQPFSLPTSLDSKFVHSFLVEGVALYGLIEAIRQPTEFSSFTGWTKRNAVLLHPTIMRALQLRPRSPCILVRNRRRSTVIVWPSENCGLLRIGLSSRLQSTESFASIHRIEESSVPKAKTVSLKSVGQWKQFYTAEDFTAFLTAYFTDAYIDAESVLQVMYFGQMCHLRISECDVALGKTSNNARVNDSVDDISYAMQNISFNEVDLNANAGDLLTASIMQSHIEHKSLASNEVSLAACVRMDNIIAFSLNTHFNIAHEKDTIHKDSISTASDTRKKISCDIPLAIINPDWDFTTMGIGGLDNEFSAIFRRAFASRVFPPEFIEQLGMKHVRGLLLFGPPGTGKTLMARQIGKMLNSREPKIVNGPEILDKYVGESEANIRKLFADAEDEWKRCGTNSGLHMIIFDEIDAICKKRGSQAGTTAVHDTVVNQLLSKMDGVDQLNNILVIGMTNRKDMIDEALLRPGRMEVQMEISLPDEHGRLQILNIHTARMREHDKLDSSVHLATLAKLTSNFSGAEIEGLVRAAQSSAMNRLVKAGGKVELDEDAVDKLMVGGEDFDYALQHDVQPAFGQADPLLQRYVTDELILWSESVSGVLEEGELLVKMVKTAESARSCVVSALLAGPPNSGKTALAARIAHNSDLPFVRVCTPQDMVGFSESAKCQALAKVFDDAHRSPFSVILVDNVERLLDYAPIGPRYSNLVLQALLVLLKKQPPPGRRLLVLATASNRSFLAQLDVLSAFGTIIDIPPLTTTKHVMAVLDELQVFSCDDLEKVRLELTKQRRFFIGIRKLLDIIDLVKQSDDTFRPHLFLQRMAEEHGTSWDCH